MDFSAKAIVMKYENNKWVEFEPIIKSISDIRGQFHPFEDSVTQVNLDKNRKIYYNVNFMTEGVQARVVDDEDTLHYMCSPLMLVQCDDTKPIDITEEIKNSIKDAIDFL